MDEAARVLAQCIAAPDDDAPRLVWADLVGGERGELVVVQCDLARGGLTVEEARARHARERELLAAHAVEWAGETARRARRWSFHRGFVEAVLVDVAFEPIEEPLLRAITVDAAYIEDLSPLVARLGELRPLEGLAVIGPSAPDDGPRLAQLAPVLPRLAGLRSFGWEHLQAGDLPVLHELLAHAPIEQLWLRDPMVGDEQLVDLLDRAPRLVALELLHTALPGGVLARPLRALRVEGIAVSALLPHAPRLERFSGYPSGTELWRAFAAMSRVEVLELAADERVLEALLDPRVELPALRSLTVRTTQEVGRVRDRFAGRIAHLELDAREPALLHLPETASTGITCARLTAPVAIADLSAGRVHLVPPIPADGRIAIGRTLDCEVRLAQHTVGRRHADLVWRDDGFGIRDLASSAGTILRGEYVQKAALADGDELVLGEAYLRYFVGPGAADRARAAVADAATRDPVTRLPWGTPERQLAITGWQARLRELGPLYGNLVLRALAEQLAAALAPGEQLTVVEPGVFGVEPAAPHLARRYTLTVQGDPIELELAHRSE